MIHVFSTEDNDDVVEEKIPSFLPQKTKEEVKKERFFKRTDGQYLM